MKYLLLGLLGLLIAPTIANAGDRGRGHSGFSVSVGLGFNDSWGRGRSYGTSYGSFGYSNYNSYPYGYGGTRTIYRDSYNYCSPPIAYTPPVAYYAPAPVYYAPSPSYYAPAPVYYAPRPVIYQSSPVYFAPAPVYVAPRPAFGTPVRNYYYPSYGNGVRSSVNVYYRR